MRHQAPESRLIFLHRIPGAQECQHPHVLPRPFRDGYFAGCGGPSSPFHFPFVQSHFSPECRVLNSSCRRPWRACRGRRWTQSWRHSIDFRWISRSRSRLVCKTKEERAPKSKRVRSHERDPKHRTRTVGWINKIKKNVSAVGSDARRKTKG